MGHEGQPLIDTAALSKSLPALFQNKATLRQVFYAELLDKAPELEVHFLANDVRQTEMFEKFIGDMMRAVVSGVGVRQFAEKFALTHRSFSLTPPQIHAANQAFHRAFQAALADTPPDPAERDALWIPFLDRVFDEFEFALLRAQSS
jgi:hemoglobin-like flavoprotein